MVNVFDTRVIKHWKSSPEAPVDSLLLEVFKSGLNAFLQFCCPSKRDLFKAVPWQGAHSSSGPPRLSRTPHQRNAAGDTHTCLSPWHEDIGVSDLTVLGDKAACSTAAPWLQFYSLLPSLWDKPAQDHQWLGVSPLIPGKELVKAADGFIFAGRLKQIRK